MLSAVASCLHRTHQRGRPHLIDATSLWYMRQTDRQHTTLPTHLGASARICGVSFPISPGRCRPPQVRLPELQLLNAFMRDDPRWHGPHWARRKLRHFRRWAWMGAGECVCVGWKLKTLGRSGTLTLALGTRHFDVLDKLHSEIQYSVFLSTLHSKI